MNVAPGMKMTEPFVDTQALPWIKNTVEGKNAKWCFVSVWHRQHVHEYITSAAPK